MERKSLCGLRSAPKIFNSVADALEWILHRFGIQELFHYLDDCITIGSADLNECAINKEIMTVTCGLLGTPLAQEKCEGPSIIITFLGIEIDTTNMQLQLPKEKLDRLSQLVTEWSIKKSCTKRELDSLIGQLQHAYAVVNPGRSFLKVYLAAIRHANCKNRNRTRAQQDPKIKNTPEWHQEDAGPLIQTKSHPSFNHSRKIKQVWSPRAQEEDIIMLWAASALCFFGFFRMGELTTPDVTNYCTQKHLSLGDIAIDSHHNPTVLRIFLKTSKTDCEFKGAHIFVGKTEDDLCPVAAVTAFLAIRGNSPGPMFQFKDRTPLTKQRFIFHIRSALQSAGIDPHTVCRA